MVPENFDLGERGEVPDCYIHLHTQEELFQVLNIRSKAISGGMMDKKENRIYNLTTQRENFVTFHDQCLGEEDYIGAQKCLDILESINIFFESDLENFAQYKVRQDKYKSRYASVTGYLSTKQMKKNHPKTRMSDN